MSLIKLMIDGQEIEVPEGTTLLEVAQRLGIHTPTLCNHERLNCGSNCRACVMELEGARTLVPSCSRPAANGMTIRTDSERVRRSRRMVFELLMTETDTSAAPELLAYAGHYGSNPERYPATLEASAARQAEPIIDNPFFVRDYAKCIACQRCVQACGDDIQHTFAIAMIGTGSNISVGAGHGANDLSASPCVFCGNCVGVCPTGALMPIPEFEARQAGELASETLTWSPAEGFKKAKEVAQPCR